MTKESDIIIVGAGIIGLSIALELQSRGAQVTILERDTALSHASTAAAGMLAADDPHNPPELSALAHLSLSLYPTFLANMEKLSGHQVPFQTNTTHQYSADGSTQTLAENSLDPRQLAVSLLAAVRATNINLSEHTTLSSPANTRIIYATGAWSPAEHLPITPTKGQMLRVQIPSNLTLREVHRAEDIYIVPRTTGPNAGTALIGATLENAGYNTSTNPSDLAALQQRAAELLPQLASAPIVESWAGLRPDTPDHLPLIGSLNNETLIATGHFRNGILLAPATARVIADLAEHKTPAIDLSAFSPSRFTR